MRFHTTLGHSQAIQAWKDAYAAHDAFAEAGDDGVSFGGTAEADIAARCEREALAAAMEHPSVTPTELREKIALMRAQGPLSPDNLCWDLTEVLDGMEHDLKRMQGWPVSEGVLTAWMDWRAHNERYAAAFDDEENDAMLPERNRLYAELHRTVCTTPGDFILKQYARLHGVVGSTLYGAAEKDGTGNLYDIDIDNGCFEGGIFESFEYPASYADIDATDVGANLLAYGLPHFDAKGWMERADSVGQGASLVQQQDGRWSLGLHLVYPEESEGKLPAERIRRERDRLLRILNFQGGAERYRALGEELRCNWPRLVHSLPAEVIS